MDKPKKDGLFDRALAVLHRMLNQLHRLYDITAESTKLHVEREHRVIATHVDYHRLGEEVYRLMQDNPDMTELSVTELMRSVAAGIRNAKAQIRHHDERIDGMTVVNEN
jgi:hypothetical protein